MIPRDLTSPVGGLDSLEKRLLWRQGVRRGFLCRLEHINGSKSNHEGPDPVARPGGGDERREEGVGSVEGFCGGGIPEATDGDRLGKALALFKLERDLGPLHGSLPAATSTSGEPT